MITSEQVRNAIMKLNYDENVGIIQDYVLQQEKVNKLLYLYKEKNFYIIKIMSGYNYHKKLLNITNNILKLESELN